MRAAEDGGQVADHALVILDALDEGVLVVAPDATILAANKGFCDMVRLPRDQVVGAGPPYPWWPEAGRRERLARLREEIAANVTVHHHQLVFQRADGHLILADGRLRRLGDESGRFVLSYREVTDEALRDQRTARMVDTTTDALIRVAPDGTLLFVSDGAAGFAGMPPEEVMGSSMLRFLHPDDLAVVGPAFERALAGEVSTVDYRFISGSGEVYWLEGTSAPITGLDGSVIEVQVLARDITDRVQAGQLNEAVLAVVASEAAGADRAGVERVIAEQVGILASAASVAVFRALGTGMQATATWPRGADAGDLGLAQRAGRSRTVVRDTVPGGAPALAVGLPVTRGAGGAIVVRGADAPRSPEILAEFAARVGVALTAAEAHEQLRLLADTDPLTGLLNRRSFGDALAQALAAAATGGGGALAILDIDRLKLINDEGGHAAGDSAVLHVAHCIRGAARGGDAIGRLGGDEFAWIIGEADLDAARSAADRVRAAVREPGPGVPPMSVSIGVTVLQAGDDADAALRRADALLYAAKEAGRDRTEAA